MLDATKTQALFVWNMEHCTHCSNKRYTQAGTLHEQLKDSSLIYSGAFDVYDFWEINLLANKNVKILFFNEDLPQKNNVAAILQ